jgi:hypothetical protein
MISSKALVPGKQRSVTGHFTESEYQTIREHVKKHRSDMSTATRELWLRELQLEEMLSERSASRQMLEIFVRTMEASLERGSEFTVQEFRRLCKEVLAQGDVVKGNAA